MPVDKKVLQDPMTIVQSEIHTLPSATSPEGNLKMKAGSIVTNQVGKLYVKSTDESLATGWVEKT